MNTYIIGLLIAILVIIYFLKKNEQEYFSNLLIKNEIFTKVLNEKYIINAGVNNVSQLNLINTEFIVPATIYTMNDKDGNYHYIYNNGKIMTFVDGKLFFNQTSASTIMSKNYNNNYKIYKTINNKLYYLINNTKMYITSEKDSYSINLILTTDEDKALSWEII
jgi:hypothetical protein